MKTKDAPQFGSRAFAEPPQRKTALKKSAITPDAALPREVRIIGGAWKRSKLPVALMPGLRPTPDRVRETVFNWLGADMSGWRCLDAFAGSGVLGFEAASRGASSVILLEREHRQVRSLVESKLRLKADALRVEAADALSWMGRAAAKSFELIFIDPPFDSSLLEPALRAATRLLVPDGFIYLEAASAQTDDTLAPFGLKLHRHMRAGQVHAHVLTTRAEGYTAPPSGL